MRLISGTAFALCNGFQDSPTRPYNKSGMKIKRVYSALVELCCKEKTAFLGEKTFPSAILFMINLKYTALRSNPSFCGERLTSF
jgi:hypothetical protein